MDDDEGGGAPFLVYALVGILAVIGLFTVFGWLLGTVWFVVRLAIIAVIVLLGIGIVRAVAGGGRRRSEL